LKIVGEDGVHSHVGNEIIDGTNGAIADRCMENTGSEDEAIRGRCRYVSRMIGDDETGGAVDLAFARNRRIHHVVSVCSDYKEFRRIGRGVWRRCRTRCF
jgi:hypothetical protein